MDSVLGLSTRNRYYSRYLVLGKYKAKRDLEQWIEGLTKSLERLEERKPLEFWSQGYSTTAEIWRLLTWHSVTIFCQAVTLSLPPTHPTVEQGVWHLPALPFAIDHLLTWNSLERWQSGIAFLLLSTSLMNTPNWWEQFTARSLAARRPAKYILSFSTSLHRK